MDHVTIPRTLLEIIYDDIERLNFYNKDELHIFLKIAEQELDDKYFMLFRPLAFTGARKGEALALHLG